MKKISEKGKVSFGQAFKDFFTGYFDFRGRSTRAGYWWAQLAIGIVYILLCIWMLVSFASYRYDHSPSALPIIILFVYTLGLIVPSFALSVRRLRDTGIRGKAMIAIYVVYFALLYTNVFAVYSTMLSNLPAMVDNAMEFGNDAIPMMPNVVSSPFLTFFMMVFSIFLSVSAFLPTDIFATESDNAILTSIFRKK